MNSKNLLRSIKVSFQKEGFHKYPDAPEEVAFLRDTHRHMFGFKATIQVWHNERELEFILVKRRLEAYVAIRISQDANNSCETLAEDLIDFILATYGDRVITVEVNEDSENGAVLVYNDRD